MSVVNSPVWELLLQAVLCFPGTFPFACVLSFWAMGCCCFLSSLCNDCFTVLFCPSQLPTGLYKKVLVILHDSILPYMNEPTLMIDFLTVAYGIGECKQAFCPSWGSAAWYVWIWKGCWMQHHALGGWNKCTFGWDEARELVWTLLSLKMICFYPCLSVLLSLYVRKIIFKASGSVEYWSDFF